jgi:translocation and assembly module TamB
MPRRLAIVLTSVLVMIAIAFWIVTSEIALRWVVNQAVQRSGGTLAVSGVSGSLLWGPIKFARIAYRSPGVEINADRGRIDFARWPLLFRNAEIDRFEVESISVVRHPEAHPVSAKPPEQLHLPVVLTIQELRANRIEWVRGESRFAAGPLIASAQTQAQNWSAEIKSLQTMLGTLAAKLSVGTAQPFALQGGASLTGTKLAYEAKAQIAGTLQRIDVRANANAANAIATANAIVMPFASGPIEHLSLEATNVDPRYFRAEAPSAKLKIQMSADRLASGEQLRGALDAVNTEPGTFDAGRLPISRLAGKLEGRPADFALSNLLLELGNAGKVSGKGRVRGGDLDLDLTTRGVDMQRVHRRFYPTKLAGTVRARATQDRQRFMLALTQKDGHVDLDADLRNGKLTIERLRAAAGGGRLVARGSLGVTGDKPFVFQGTLTNFDPSRFGRFVAARINSRFGATGALAPVLQLKADLDVFDSQWSGMATRARSAGARAARARRISRSTWSPTSATRMRKRRARYSIRSIWATWISSSSSRAAISLTFTRFCRSHCRRRPSTPSRVTS